MTGRRTDPEVAEPVTDVMLGGTSLGLLQADVLLDLLAAHADDRDVSRAFDSYCEQDIRPWYDDHVASDSSLLRNWTGRDLDAEAPLTSDLVCAAAAVLPELIAPVRDYQAMMARPETLVRHHEAVRALLRNGWRPVPDDGPSATFSDAPAFLSRTTSR